MKKILIAVALCAASSTVFAAGQSQLSAAQSQSGSGAAASTGAINFNSASPNDHQRIDTTPSLYMAPSMFGNGGVNCGQSSTVGAGVTGFVLGASIASNGKECQSTSDTQTFAKLGLMRAALLRFACFGEDVNRKVYEADGNLCPSSATAKGIAGAPVGPKFLVAEYVQTTLHQHINQDGTISSYTTKDKTITR